MLPFKSMWKAIKKQSRIKQTQNRHCEARFHFTKSHLSQVNIIMLVLQLEHLAWTHIILGVPLKPLGLYMGAEAITAPSNIKSVAYKTTI